MIKKFDTGSVATAPISGTPSTGGSTGSTKKIIVFLAVIGVAYLGYKYVVKPMLDKNKEEK